MFMKFVKIIIIAQFSLSFSCWAAADFQYQDKSLLPINSYQKSNELLEHVFLDPDQKYEHFEAKQLNKIASRYKLFEKTKFQELKKQNLTNLRNLYEDLNYYYHYIIKNKFGYTRLKKSEPTVTYINQRELQLKIVALSKVLQTHSKSQPATNKYLFQVALHQSILDNSLAPIQSAWSQLKKGALSKKRKRILYFGVLLADLESKQEHIRSAAAKKLKRLNYHLNKSAMISLNLALSKYYGQDKKSKHPKDESEQYLKFVARLCNNLSPSQNESIFKAMINIWKSQRKSQQDWNLPFANNCFKTFPLYHGIEERRAISLMKEKRYEDALQLYKNLEASVRSVQIQTRLNYQHLAIANLIYLKTSDINQFHSLLLSSYRKYSHTSKYKNILAPKLFNVTMDELNKRCVVAKSKYEANICESIGDNYLSLMPKNHMSKEVKITLAGIMTDAKKYQKSVKLYLELYKNFDDHQKEFYLRRAINAQAAIAKWPIETPWAAAAPTLKFTKESAKLLALFYKLKAIQKNENWFTLIPIGVLELRQGKFAQVLALWSNAIEKDSTSKETPKAVSHLLNIALQKSHYLAIDKLGRVVKSNNITIDKNLFAHDFKQTYELALKKNYAAAIKQKNYHLAIEKLQTLKSDYPLSKDFPLYLFTLAQAYKYIGEYEQSVKTLKQIIATKNHNFYEPSILKLAKELEAMGRLNESLVYFQRYLSLSKKENYDHKIKYAQLLISLDRFNIVERMYKNLDWTKLSKSHRVAIIEQLNTIFHQTNNEAQQLELAKAVLKQGDLPKKIRIKGIHLLAKQAFLQKSTDRLKQLEKTLTQNFNKSRLRREELNHIWFLQISLLGETFLEKTRQNVQIATASSMQRLKVQYFNLKTSYQGMCYQLKNSYCMVSLSHLSALTKKTKAILKQEISRHKAIVEDSLSKMHHVLSGYKYISLHDDKLNDEIEKHAYKTFTLPHIASSVLWTTKMDLNFSDSKIAGPGFTQISSDTTSLKGVAQ